MSISIFLPLFKTFFARGIAASGAFFLSIVVARLYGAEGSGVFSLAQSFLMASVILCKAGMDSALVRFLNEKKIGNNSDGYLSYSFRKAIINSVAAGFLLYCFSEIIANFYHSHDLSVMLKTFSLSVFPLTACYIFSGIYKGMHKPSVAVLLESGGVSLFAVGIISALYLMSYSELDASSYSVFISSWVLFFVSLYLLNKKEGIKFKIYYCKEGLSEFSKSSNSFLVMSMASLSQGTLSIILAGAILNNSEVGIFRAAERIAMLVSFVVMVINAIYPAKFAKLYYEKKLNDMQVCIASSIKISVFLAAPLIMICLFFPEFLLSVFGNEFKNGALVLRLIVLGQVVNLLLGPSNFLLNLTGNEKLLSAMVICCNVISLITFLMLSIFFESAGAALGLAIMLSLQNIVGAFLLWKKTRILVLPLLKGRSLDG